MEQLVVSIGDKSPLTHDLRCQELNGHDLYLAFVLMDDPPLEWVQSCAGAYQESCPLGVLELSTFLKLTSI